MGKTTETPAVLTIAGSDSGGGAGIQADLKAFAALGVHGTCVVTCVTAQNPRSVLAIHPCPPQIVRRQLEAVFELMPPAAVKTGMLFSGGIIQVLAEFFGTSARPPLVVDPVLVSTSGKPLLQPRAMKVLTTKLLPLAALITPNLDEARVLCGSEAKSPEAMRSAARQLHGRFGCAVLLKGGHLRGGRQAIDILYNGRDEWVLEAPFIKGVLTHGTGCTYASAIAGGLALGHDLPSAVTMAKRLVTKAISGHWQVAGFHVLNPFHEL